MTYWLLNLVFLAVAAGVATAAAAAARRRAGAGPEPGWRYAVRAAALAFAVLCLLTAVFDNIMIGAGLFDFGPEHISGWRIGLAPLEDFCYVLAAAVLLPALWSLAPAGRRRGDD